MKNIKFIAFALIACGWLSGIAVRAQETERKISQTSPELREKAVELLKNLANDADGFSSSRNRVVARIGVAELLWSQDEKRARSLYQSAINEIGNLLSQIQPIDDDATDQESGERYQLIYEVRDMRSSLLQSLAPLDPAMALDAMRVLTSEFTDGEDYVGENKALELTLASRIAEKDPDTAYETAKKNLAKGLSYNLFPILEEIYQTDEKTGTKLAKDIFSKITSVSTKIGDASTADGDNVSTYDIATFYTTVKKLNRTAERNKKTALLTDSDLRQLVELLAKAYAAQEYLSAYEVAPIIEDLTKFSPAQAQVLRRKLGENSGDLATQVRDQAFDAETDGKSPEDILQIIAKKPAADRDALYGKVAEKAVNDGDTARAKVFHDRIKTKPEYDYVGNYIKNDLPSILGSKADLSEIRAALGRLKSPEQRLELLARSAETVGRGGDAKTASALTEEARSLYNGRMRQQKNLDAILNLSRAYLQFQPDSAFNLLESNMPSFNNLINAAVTVEDFNQTGSVEEDELLIADGLTTSYKLVKNGSTFFQDAAKADFDRTIGLTNQLSRPEVRFLAQLRLAEALLDADPARREKEQQKKIAESQEGDI